MSVTGALLPLYCTSDGKALLASLPEEQAEMLLPARLTPFTAHTITTRKTLWEELSDVRASGVAFDREEYTVGICGVGCVVSDPYGPIAAISVPVPTQRFHGNEERLTRALVRTCRECSVARGA